MADNMCGPSNGAKDLVLHADRDRSLHQDRLVGAPTGGNQTFRNKLPTANGDAAFQSFQSGFVGPQAGSSVSGLPNTFGNMDAAHRHMVVEQELRRAGYAPGIADAQVNRHAANLAMSVEQYQAFVQAFGANPGVAASHPANMMRSASDPMRAPQSIMAEMRSSGANHIGMEPPTGFLPMMANGNQVGSARPMWPTAGPMMHPNNAFAMPQDQGTIGNTQAIHADPALAISAEDFERAFDEIEQDTEFQEELDNWMSVHGPAAERAHQQHAAEPTTQEWDAMTSNLERLAVDNDAAGDVRDVAMPPESVADKEATNEEESKVQIQGDIARVAGTLLSSVADNTSQKFQESNFFALMRRLRDMEVTVMDNAIVDVQSGTPVVNHHSDADYSNGGGVVEGTMQDDVQSDPEPGNSTT